MRKVKCECGKETSKNCWKLHIKSNKCLLSEERKEEILMILNIRTKNKWGWLIEEGENAILCPDWFVSVVQKQTKLKDWRFTPPRKIGCCTFKTTERFKKERRGRNNPAVKSKVFNFTENDVYEYVKELMDLYLYDNSFHFGDFHNLINIKFPNYMFLITETIRSFGKNRDRALVKWSTGLTDEEVTKIAFKKRGFYISKGQKTSEKCIESARECG